MENIYSKYPFIIYHLIRIPKRKKERKKQNKLNKSLHFSCSSKIWRENLQGTLSKKKNPNSYLYIFYGMFILFHTFMAWLQLDKCKICLYEYTGSQMFDILLKRQRRMKSLKNCIVSIQI